MARRLLVACELIILESIELLLLVLQSILWPVLHLLRRLAVCARAVTSLVRLLLNALVLRLTLDPVRVHLRLCLHIADLVRRLRLRKCILKIMRACSLLLLIMKLRHEIYF